MPYPSGLCCRSGIGTTLCRNLQRRSGPGNLLLKLLPLYQVLWRLDCQHDFGVEEGAGDAGGDGDQGALIGKDFDMGDAGNVGKIDGASAADEGDGGFVGGD